LTDAGLICYGFFERTQGLGGRLVLRVFVLGTARALKEGTRLHCMGREYRVRVSREKDGASVTVELDGVDSLEQASELRGEEVFMNPRDATGEGLPLPVYLFEGFSVVSGDRSFPVLEVEWNPVNPQVILQGARGPFPVPMNLLAGGSFDMETRRVEARLPEGLEDL
jgi:hypothetical protein